MQGSKVCNLSRIRFKQSKNIAPADLHFAWVAEARLDGDAKIVQQVRAERGVEVSPRLGGGLLYRTN